MNCRRSTIMTNHLLAALAILTALCPGQFPVRAAQSEPTGTTPASPEPSMEALQARLKAAQERLDTRKPQIERQLKAIAEELQRLEPPDGKPLAPAQAVRRNELNALRAAMQNELGNLQLTITARQGAVDSCEVRLQFRQDLEVLRERVARRSVFYGPAEQTFFRAQITQINVLRGNIQRMSGSRLKRLDALKTDIEKADPTRRLALETERELLLAQLDGAAEAIRRLQSHVDLLEAKLAVTPSPATSSGSQPATGPSDQKEAENKHRLAEFVEIEARGAQEEARRRLHGLRLQLARPGLSDRERADMENDCEYWQEKISYEERRLRQADMEKRAAMEKRGIATLQQKLAALASLKTELEASSRRFSAEERMAQAEDFQKEAAASRERAKRLEERSEAERPDADMWVAFIQTFDAMMEALKERRDRDYNFDHFLRMRDLLDLERQQVNAVMNTSEVTNFAMLRQATLERQIAELQSQCAHVLVPPTPSFWVRQRRVINSIQIVALTFLSSYGVNLVVWLIHRITRWASVRIGSGRVSVKRLETVLSFFGSIVKLFLWIFALILVLNEFNIDPAKSTGAIGLIGLVMAGMFQQLVIDFVKGLDIVTGRHYNVGDYVELDGKTGHVIDFNVKHTRIRTASGQEYNLPNSKCIPSRRFPDGFVDNYVDFTLKSPADAARAKRAIVAVCRHLSRRVEQVKDEPILSDRFPGPRPESVILRYRVRVLPACGWVITRHFIPDVKSALAYEQVELAEEPQFFFINRIQTFRQLFSSQLTEEEIIRETQELDAAEEAAPPSPPPSP